MNLSQFGAIVNDNIYKLTMVFLLIDVLGKMQASTILSKTGAIFVIPFLLFSSAAGVLADRFSKKWILVVMKLWEALVFLAAIPICASGHPFGCFLLLFFLGIHSAVFGPSKYGIIPELVDKASIAKANSAVTSTTYLGIILGTFLGTLLADLTDRTYPIIMGICFALSCLGLLCAFVVRTTPRQGSTKTMSLFFIREVCQTLVLCRPYKHLRMTLASAAFFLFVAAYTQLAVIPYTLQSLGLNEVAGGYIFLCTALGIALGAILAGRIFKKKVDLAIPALTLFALSFLFFSLYLIAGSLVGAILTLGLIGIVGGLFIVPIDSFIQITCPDDRRGQVIGTGNFLGFVGVFVASLCLYLFGQVFQCTAAESFAVIGSATFLFALYFALRHSDILTQALSRKLAKGEIIVQNLQFFSEQGSSPTLVLAHATLKKILYITRWAPEYHFLFPGTMPSFLRLLARVCYHFHFTAATQQALTHQALSIRAVGIPVCIILRPHRNKKFDSFLLADKSQPLLFVDVQIPCQKNSTQASIIFNKQHYTQMISKGNSSDTPSFVGGI